MSADFPWLREAAHQLDRPPRGEIVRLPVPLRVIEQSSAGRHGFPEPVDVVAEMLRLSVGGAANDPEPPRAA
jgi:hypothetical protein